MHVWILRMSLYISYITRHTCTGGEPLDPRGEGRISTLALILEGEMQLISFW